MLEPQTFKTITEIIKVRGFLVNLHFILNYWKEKTLGRSLDLVFDQFELYYGMDSCYASLLFLAIKIEYKYVDSLMCRVIELEYIMLDFLHCL